MNGICNEEFKTELWQEVVSAGEELAEILNVRLVIDDVRPETIMIWKENFYDK